MTMQRRPFVVTLFAAAALGAGCASAPPMTPVTLKVNVFPGSSNLALLVAIDQGLMARRGLNIEIQNTPNSEQQRAGLAAGRFEIAHAAVDNALAMVEVAKADVIIVSGGDAGLNEFKGTSVPYPAWQGLIQRFPGGQRLSRRLRDSPQGSLEVGKVKVLVRCRRFSTPHAFHFRAQRQHLAPNVAERVDLGAHHEFIQAGIAA